MVAGVAAASMSLPRSLCRLSLPAAFVAGSYILSLSLSGSRSQILCSGGALRKFPLRNSSSWPLLPPPEHYCASFSKPVPMTGFRMSKVGASGSSSLSSSAAAGGTTSEDVLDFWFEGVGPESGVYKRKEWFVSGPEFDGECEKKFGECLKLASSGALEGWMTTARGRLALVILLDQITRNVYRNSAASYAQDPTAIKITLDTIEQGWDKELTPTERRFLYMPLMHSENMRDHEIVDRLFEDLASDYSDNEKLHEQLFAVLVFERKHSAILKKFGRYPSRNAVLGRANTEAEEEFLAKGGGW